MLLEAHSVERFSVAGRRVESEAEMLRPSPGHPQLPTSPKLARAGPASNPPPAVGASTEVGPRLPAGLQGPTRDYSGTRLEIRVALLVGEGEGSSSTRASALWT